MSINGDGMTANREEGISWWKKVAAQKSADQSSVHGTICSIVAMDTSRLVGQQHGQGLLLLALINAKDQRPVDLISVALGRLARGCCQARPCPVREIRA